MCYRILRSFRDTKIRFCAVKSIFFLKGLKCYAASGYNKREDTSFSNEYPNFVRLKHKFMSVHKEVKRITTHILQEMKQRGEKISMLTAYDYSMATVLDDAGLDVLLVGDSASNVMAGHETTLPITLDQMIYHAQGVVRGATRAFVVVDLPFGSYQGNSKEALSSAIRIMKESGAHGVKLEGGTEIVDSIERIITAGIPVMGHLGLTPQSIYKFGTYTVRAKDEAEAAKLKLDAQALQDAGCFGIVLEKIPALLAKEVSESLHIPMIGIGAGPHCDGQVLVVNDMIGLTKGFKPRFLRQYLNLYEEITAAAKSYIRDVKANDFPNEKEQY
jgi:3-methyl-2-oxobutanoate hydroxymethyltransferase